LGVHNVWNKSGLAVGADFSNWTLGHHVKRYIAKEVAAKPKFLAASGKGLIDKTD
jgi:hypothetical protein